MQNPRHNAKHVWQKKGVHTITIETKGFICGITVSATIVARNYNEHKHYSTLFDSPFATKVTYQTITQSDITLQKVTVAIPSIVLFFTPTNTLNKIAQVSLKVAEALSIVVSLDFATPDMAVGQYYKTTTSYTSNCECVIKLEIFPSQAAFKNGESPIYTSTTTMQLPS